MEPTGRTEDFQAYYDAQPTEALLSKETSVEVVGKRCVYVHDTRVAGSKPYYTENLPNHRFETTVRCTLDAFSEAELEAAVRERKARRKYFARWHAAKADLITQEQS